MPRSGGETQLLLRVDQKGGGIGAGVPVLQIGWIPLKLVFAARGSGPFQLAYGSTGAKPAALTIDAVIPGYKSDAPFAVEPASVGEPVTLAGPARLRPSVDYKRWTLWIILIIGVAALGFMAYRLARQVAQAPSPSPPTDKRTKFGHSSTSVGDSHGGRHSCPPSGLKNPLSLMSDGRRFGSHDINQTSAQILGFETPRRSPILGSFSARGRKRKGRSAVR